MVTFVASQPLNMSTFFGVTDAEPETSYEASATELTIVKINSVFVLRGSGLTYAEDGTLTGGTITEMEESWNGSPAWSITGASYDAAVFESFYDPVTDVLDLEGMNTFLFSGDDSVTGSEGNDSLIGAAGSDTLQGLGGDDFLAGYVGSSGEGGEDVDGADSLDGGDGNDTLRGNAGDDTLVGGAGNDNLRGDAGNDVIDGGEGADAASYRFDEFEATAGVHFDASSTGGGSTIVFDDGRGGMDTLIGIDSVVFTGTAHDDTAIGGSGGDQLSGNGGNDSLDGGDGNDRLLGDDDAFAGTGNDLLVGGAGNDLLLGGGGDDTLIGGAGDDTFSGYAGVDTLDFSDNATGIVLYKPVDIGAELDPLGTVTHGDGSVDRFYVGTADVVIGSGHADLLVGSPVYAATWGEIFGNDELHGGDGNDTIQGLGGDDELFGGAGDDLLEGGEDAGDGNGLWGGAGNDTLDGTGGLSYAIYLDAEAGIVADLSTGTVSDDGFGGSDTLVAIAGIGGSHFADSLTGSDGDDEFAGFGGNDTIDGGAGFDIVYYDEDEVTATVLVNLEAGTASGGFGVDTDTLVSIEGAVGGANGDSLVGSTAANLLAGWLGDDSLVGGDGNDTLMGEEGADSLVGGAGDDSIDGGAGADTLFGDAGNDTLVGGGNGAREFDFAIYAAADDSIVVDLVAGTASAANLGEDSLIGIDGVIASVHSDTLIGDDADNFFRGRGGSDVIDGGDGFDIADYRDSGAVVASLDITQTASYLENVLGSTTLPGGTDTLSGIEGLIGSQFADSLTGSAGNNFFRGNNGDDTIDGGDGIDTVAYDQASGAVAVHLGDETASGANGNDTLLDVENVRGSAYNDTLRGSDGDNELEGGDGNDFLAGRGGNDTLLGGNGTGDWADYRSASGAVVVSLAAQGEVQDTGGDGVDLLEGMEGLIGSAQDDALSGASANGVFELFAGGAGDDTIDGGEITDLINYTDGNQVEYWLFNPESGVDVDLEAQTASDGQGGTDTLVNINFVIGSNRADTITGSNGTLFEAFTGLGGADHFDGGDLLQGAARINYNTSAYAVRVDLAAGTAQDGTTAGGTSIDTFTNINFVRGSNFNDTLLGSNATGWTESFEGRAGNDSINGLGGIDQVRYQSASGAVTVNLATGSATGADGTDTLSGIENVRGSESSDTITGDAQANRLEGRNGNDTIAGGAGNDTILGEGGSDLLQGGDGEDFFVGSSGSDTIDGGNQPVNLPDGAGNPGRQFFDIVDYSAASGGVRVDLGAGTARLISGATDSDTLVSVEGVRGGGFSDILIGDDGDNLLRGNGGNDSLVGGDGYDVADYSNDTAGVVIDLVAGRAHGSAAGTDTLVGMEVGIGGSGDDSIVGNGGANGLRGSAGDDYIDGGAGIDRADYRTASGAVSVNLATNRSAGADGVDTLAGIENARGSDLYNDTLTGSTGNNVLEGRGGNDSLVGGGGSDTLIGDDGNDTYVVDAGDTVIETGTSASTADLVRSTVTYVLGANLENLTLDGSAGIGGTGNTLANVITGNAGANSLNGGDGADRLVGNAGDDSLNGGTGNDADTLTGGTGNDTYTIDLASDVITETSSGGSADLVISTATSYTMAAFVENLTLGGTASISAIGNALGNRMTGNSGVNTLSGGDGNDSLNGGDGSDSLVGGNGNDTLVGGVGTDRDSMVGGVGNDTYYVDVSTDLITETSSGGTADVVRSTATSYTMAAFVENLVLEGTAGIAATGNTLNNLITGNTGANALNGGTGNDSINGGAGNDVITGGAGNDSLTGSTGLDAFVFNTALSATTNVDRLAGFVSADDTIRLENAIFTKLTTTGTLASTAFARGTAALDAGDRIIYNSATGQIWYDSDGTGAAAKILFATVTAGTAISHTDFVII